MRAGRFAWRLLTSLLLSGVFVGQAAAQAVPSDPIAAKAALCSACHGANGIPITKDIPVISGQHAGYIFLELRDFQSGARKSSIMEPIAKTLSRSDMLALGEYFEKQAWPALEQPSAPDKLAAAAQAMAASGQCTQCHLSGFLGDSTNPRLADQSVAYLRKTMLDFHTGARGNNPWMAALLKTFSDDDIAAMATYLGGL